MSYKVTEFILKKSGITFIHDSLLFSVIAGEDSQSPMIFRGSRA